jgi:group II intron reverse transcriptase/maturase
MSQWIAYDNRRKPGVALALHEEPMTDETCTPGSATPKSLMERVLTRGNLQRALKRVRQNKGAPGIDGMTADELPAHLKEHWLDIRAKLVAGNYRPKPALRAEIPKDDGKTRPLGIPVVADRFIQQAIAQVVSEQWEPHFHSHSYGFRPNRSAHQAIREIQAQVRSGKAWVVDMDIEAFFDRVNHDRLKYRLKQHVADDDLPGLINAYLKAGVMQDGKKMASTMGRTARQPLAARVGQYSAGRTGLGAGKARTPICSLCG